MMCQLTTEQAKRINTPVRFYAKTRPELGLRLANHTLVFPTSQRWDIITELYSWLVPDYTDIVNKIKEL